MIVLETKLENIKGIGPRFLARLRKLKIETIKDLLWHFPFRYEDFSQISKIADLKPGITATIQGQIKSVANRRSWKKRMMITEALIADNTGTIKAVWFNQPFIARILSQGRWTNIAGKLSISKNIIYFSNPAYEIINQRQETSGQKQTTKHTGRIVPVYPETKGLTSKGLRFLIKPILDSLEKIPEFLPLEVLKKIRLPEINQAIKKIHFPNKIQETESAKNRFAFEELFLIQLSNIREKLALSQEKACAFNWESQDIKNLLNQLPFELTFSQKKSLLEILRDLQKSTPMNRLLEGDVGSGKTIVAVLAAFIAAQNNCQTAFMAPTEVLARQHFKTISNLFIHQGSGFEGGIGLLCASEAKVNFGEELETNVTKTNLLKLIAANQVKIIIGTHALIQEKVKFNNLALAIIDEQHRFGVEQRAKLTTNDQQPTTKITPHFLSMSATPIPRTLALAFFSSLDISIIDELPKGRKNIITKVVDPDDRPKAYQFIRKEIQKGRQVFVICPRIEPTSQTESENQFQEVRPPEIDRQYFGGRTSQILEAKAVKEEYEKLSKKIFPDLKVAMLHGKMKAQEKEKTMSAFAKATADKKEKIDILVSTSVIEVGVDVPNATIMMIEGAERFGLAQLYQFRGRVGRGQHQSFCFLFTESASKTTHQRLKALLTAKNGFELAEKDLEIRGPGEFLGERQSGLPDLLMNSLKNLDLIKKSREAALEIINKDSELKNYPLLAQKLEKFQKSIRYS